MIHDSIKYKKSKYCVSIKLVHNSLKNSLYYVIIEIWMEKNEYSFSEDIHNIVLMYNSIKFENYNDFILYLYIIIYYYVPHTIILYT